MFSILYINILMIKSKINRKGGDRNSMDMLTKIQNISSLNTLDKSDILINSDEYIKERNALFIKSINIKNIPSIYKHKIIQIFKNFKDTNNGLIIGDISPDIKELYTDILTKRGGKSIKLLTGGGIPINTKNKTILSELNTYCRDISSRDGINDETDIQDFINNPTTSTSIIRNNEYNNLRSCIDNTTPKNFSIDISCNPRYNYFSGNEDDSSDYNFTKSYDCFDYNKDIVTAYEANYYTERNKNAIENFITKQKEYIKSLGIREKRIIQDYTNNNSFRFYCQYKNPNYPNRIDNLSFGDAFYVQIYEIFEDNKFNGKYSNLSNILGDTNLKKYNEWLNNNRIERNTESKINLDGDDWNIVLDKFILDLNNIIINAPPVEEEIYCYRGVTKHYIKGGIDAADICIFGDKCLTRSFISNRISSFSLDFNTSLKIYNLDPSNDDKALYRIAILPQCRVLYIEQLTECSGELEIIAPSNSIFYYSFDNFTNSELIPSIYYNNINKKYGICPDIELNSFDSVLAFTPQYQIPDITKAIEIARNTSINFSKGYLIDQESDQQPSDIDDKLLDLCKSIIK